MGFNYNDGEVDFNEYARREVKENVETIQSETEKPKESVPTKKEEYVPFIREKVKKLINKDATREEIENVARQVMAQFPFEKGVELETVVAGIEKE